MNENVIAQSAALRAQGKYDEAVSVVESALHQLDDETRLVALMQAFYAARDGNREMKARELARRISAIEPETPSIQSYLS